MRYSNRIDLIITVYRLCDMVLEFAILDYQRANDIGGIQLLILLPHLCTFPLRPHLFRIDLKGHELVIDARDGLLLLLCWVWDKIGSHWSLERDDMLMIYTFDPIVIFKLQLCHPAVLMVLVIRYHMLPFLILVGYS